MIVTFFLFFQGTHNLTLNFNDLLHQGSARQSIEPKLFNLDYMLTEGDPLFGFTIELTVEELKKYQYTQGLEPPTGH